MEQINQQLQLVIKITLIAMLLTSVHIVAAWAQAAGGADLIGAQPIAQSAIATIKILGGVVIVVVALAFAMGHHRVLALGTLAIGGLIIGKLTAITAAMGW